ncbi:ribosome-associated translation inhibitor RaiA [Peptoniphilus sp. GNH]|nr:ribosome-associated translation inhibitor RaiA [Peptoniphilus sp. GNH]
MKLELVGKNISLTESLKSKVEDKLSKLDKYFSDEILARATLSSTKGNQKIEVTIFLPGTILRAEDSSSDMYSSIDKVQNSLERQIKKYKTRLKKRYKDNTSIKFEEVESPIEHEDEDENTIVRRKSFDLKPMMEEEAVLQMELLNHNFFVFLNGNTEEVNIVYKREDGDYGIIEAKLK